MKQRLSVGDLAPNSILSDIDGNPVHLADLWTEGPTLLTFLRHFGCIFCREFLSELGKHEEILHKAGLQVVSVGIGEPKHAKRYCPKLAPNSLCLASSDTSAYADYGFDRMGLGDLASWNFVKSSLRAVTGGSLQGLPTGDAMMIGGNFIIDQQGIIQYAYYSETAGDHPTIEEIFEVATMLD